MLIFWPLKRVSPGRLDLERENFAADENEEQKTNSQKIQ